MPLILTEEISRSRLSQWPQAQLSEAEKWKYILISAVLEVLNLYQLGWVGLFSLSLFFSFSFNFAACRHLPRPLVSYQVENHQSALEWTTV